MRNQMLLQKLSHDHSLLPSQEESDECNGSGSLEVDINIKVNFEWDKRRVKDGSSTNSAGTTGWPGGKNKVGFLPYSYYPCKFQGQ